MPLCSLLPEIYVAGLFAANPVSLVLVDSDVDLIGRADLREDLFCGDLAAERRLDDNFRTLRCCGLLCNGLSGCRLLLCRTLAAAGFFAAGTFFSATFFSTGFSAATFSITGAAFFVSVFASTVFFVVILFKPPILNGMNRL